MNELRIVEPETHDPTATCGTGELGEIAVRSPTVSSGVWGREETGERFSDDGWLFTGDVGRRDGEGFVYVEGRVDNMILSGGIKIHPERVESVLSTHEDVASVAVVGVPHETWGTALEAHVVADALDEASIRSWCEEHGDLGEHEIPVSFVFEDALPMTPTGKVDRERLADSSA